MNSCNSRGSRYCGRWRLSRWTVPNSQRPTSPAKSANCEEGLSECPYVVLTSPIPYRRSLQTQSRNRDSASGMCSRTLSTSSPRTGQFGQEMMVPTPLRKYEISPSNTHNGSLDKESRQASWWDSTCPIAQSSFSYGLGYSVLGALQPLSTVTWKRIRCFIASTFAKQGCF